MESIPIEVLGVIFSSLDDIKDVLRVSMVCKHFQQVVLSTNSIWENLLQQWSYPLSEKVDLNESLSEIIPRGLPYFLKVSGKDLRWLVLLLYTKNFEVDYKSYFFFNFEIAEVKKFCVGDKDDGWKIKYNGYKHELGYFYEGLLNGPGVTIGHSHEHFEGNFVDGKREGEGTLYYHDLNAQLKAIWVNGVPKDVDESMLPTKILENCPKVDFGRHEQIIRVADGTPLCIFCWTHHKEQNNIKADPSHVEIQWGSHCACCCCSTIESLQKMLKSH